MGEFITTPISTLDIVLPVLASTNGSADELPGTSLLDGAGRLNQDEPNGVFASVTGEDGS